MTRFEKDFPMAAFTSIPTLEGDARFDVYVARPEGAPKAAIVVIQEIFGVNEGIRRICDNWAAADYLDMAPDLFWRQKPHFELAADLAELFQAAFGHMQQLNHDKGILDVGDKLKAVCATIGTTAPGRDRRDPGNLRRERGHPPQMR